MALRDGLSSTDPGVLFRCCGWAGDVDAWELTSLISPLLGHEDPNVAETAGLFLRLERERDSD